MSFNIVDLVKDQIGSQMVGQMGNLLGDESSKIDSGLASVVPGLLNGLTQRASVPGGAESLFDVIQNQDDGLLGNIGSMLGGGQSKDLISNGTNMLSGLLGSSGLGTLGTIISSVSGLSKGGSSSLLGMLAPIVIGVLKRKVLGDGMNPAGLLSMLNSQKDNVSAALPSGMSDMFEKSSLMTDFGSLGGNAINSATDAVSNVADAAGNTVNQAAQSVGNAANDAADAGSSWIKKLLPVGVVAVLGLLAWNFFGGSAQDAANKAGDAASSAASTVADAANVDVDKLGTDFTGMFDSAKETLGGITDVESATSAVPQLTDMADKVSGLTGMLDKVPEAARGPLTGIVSSGLESLLPLIEKLRAIPGVGGVIDPIITPMVEALQGLAG